MTVHREQSMKRKDQQNATIRCLLLTTSVSTCFGASLCPSSGEQRLCYCIWCVVLVLLDVVGSGCGALSCRIRAAYAHLQENKGSITVVGVLFWFCWMWLVAVVGALRCRMRALLVSYKAAPHNRYQPHPAEPEQYTRCSNGFFVLLKMGIMMPETC